MMNRKKQSAATKAFLVVLVVMLSVGLLLPSFASIIYAI